MKVTYDASVPKAMRAQIRERLASILPLMPADFRTVTVDYGQDEEGDGIVSVDVRRDYKRLEIHIHPLFLSDEEWEDTLMHELGHVLLGRTSALVHTLLESFVGEARTREFLRQQFREAEERSCEDFAEAVRKIKEMKP